MIIPMFMPMPTGSSSVSDTDNDFLPITLIICYFIFMGWFLIGGIISLTAVAVSLCWEISVPEAITDAVLFSLPIGTVNSVIYAVIRIIKYHAKNSKSHHKERKSTK